MSEVRSLTKLVRPLAKGQITLPIEFRRRLNIDDQTILSLTLKGRQIEIVPLRATPAQEDLREYTRDDIDRFLKEDRLDRITAAKLRRLLRRKRPA